MDKKRELNEIFESLAESLGISQTQYETLVKSYNAVGQWLDGDETLKSHGVTIYPQGSFRLGTIIQPINEDGDLDIDLVCRLKDKPWNWTQKDLKDCIGNRLKSSAIYDKMLKNRLGGRRCWTLLYRENNPDEKYHLDILPAVSDPRYSNFVSDSLSLEYDVGKVSYAALRITDNQESNYSSCIDSTQWLKSNPDGYAWWFSSRCKMVGQTQLLLEAVAPIGSYVENKTILQKSIQILKRHRDIMFGKDDDKPISIIITTLASKAYRGSDNLYDSLIDIVDGMLSYISNREGIDWVENPVNPSENFADKWPNEPQKKINFYKWLYEIQKDVHAITDLDSVSSVSDKLKEKFGENITKKTFESYAKKRKTALFEHKISANAKGTMGLVGSLISRGHTFFGK